MYSCDENVNITLALGLINSSYLIQDGMLNSVFIPANVNWIASHVRLLIN